MTVIENTLPFPPPPYDLNDNGTTFFPHEAQWQWVDYWPHVAEAWDKYSDPGERRKIMDFRYRVRCDKCYEGIQATERQRRIEGVLADEPASRRDIAEFPERLAKKHWEQYHRGEAVTMHYINHYWIWQMLGFEDLWLGKPHGWVNILDPRDQRVQQWEYDVLELGTAAADHLWNP
jgi:hypothetical protein